ncbi:MAG TPA: hypothetical protein VE422_16155 [Terriglobia bacterium]|nr:hypothetical protein [Terriglobia bacterium]
MKYEAISDELVCIEELEDRSAPGVVIAVQALPLNLSRTATIVWDEV